MIVDETRKSADAFMNFLERGEFEKDIRPNNDPVRNSAYVEKQVDNYKKIVDSRTIADFVKL